MISKIIGSNFLSWAELDFDVSSGVTLIEGYNYDDETPEGSGKSAIVNAISWAFFGKLPKEANVDDVIREGQKKCKVEIVLENGTTILRSRKPNDLALIPKDGEPIKGKDAKETQQIIEEYIGMSFETFCQSVYFAQNYPKKFVDATEQDKAKILSEIQDLSVFDKARKTVMGKLKNIDSRKDVLKSELGKSSEFIEHMENQVEREKKLKEEFERDKKAQLEKISQSIEEAKNDLQQTINFLEKSNKEELEKERESISQDIDELKTERANLNSEMDNISSKVKEKERLEYQIKKTEGENNKKKKQMETYSNPQDKKCPTCGTTLEKVDSSHFESHIRELDKEITELSQFKEKMEGELSQFEIRSSEELEKSIKEIDTTIRQINENIRRIDSQVSEITTAEQNLVLKDNEIKKYQELYDDKEKESSQSYDNQIKEIEGKLEKEKVSYKEKEAEYSGLLEESKRLSALKDGFKEVKQHVFQGILDELTHKANRYLAELFEVPVKISFSNTSSSGEVSKIKVDVSFDGVSRPLGLYSGGQFRRIQLAVDLALSQIVSERGDKPFNFRIFDEYCKDLSENSMEKMLHLFEALPGATIMIEHNTIFKSIVNNVFKVELIDGVSRNAA